MHDFADLNLDKARDLSSDEGGNEIKISIPKSLKNHIKAIKFDKQHKQDLNNYIDNRLALY